MAWSTLSGDRTEPNLTVRVPVLSPAQVSQLPERTVLVIKRSMPAAVGVVRMAWRRPDVRRAARSTPMLPALPQADAAAPEELASPHALRTPPGAGAAGMAAQIIGLGRDVESLRRLIARQDTAVRDDPRSAGRDRGAGRFVGDHARHPDRAGHRTRRRWPGGRRPPVLVRDDGSRAGAVAPARPGGVDRGCLLPVPGRGPAVVLALASVRRRGASLAPALVDRGVHRQHGRRVPGGGLARPPAPRCRGPYPGAERRGLFPRPACSGCRAGPAAFEDAGGRRHSWDRRLVGRASGGVAASPG